MKLLMLLLLLLLLPDVLAAYATWLSSGVPCQLQVFLSVTQWGLFKQMVEQL